MSGESLTDNVSKKVVLPNQTNCLDGLFGFG